MVDRAQGCWDSKRRLDALGTVAPVVVSMAVSAHSERLLGGGQQAPHVANAEVSDMGEALLTAITTSSDRGRLGRLVKLEGQSIARCDLKSSFSA